MFLKGTLIKVDSRVFDGKNGGKVHMHNMKVRESYKNGDESHYYVKHYGDLLATWTVGKTVELEVSLTIRNQDGKQYANLVTVQ